MKKKLLAVAMGAMLAAGAANAVTVNHAALGDLLVAPAHLIGGGSQDQPAQSAVASIIDAQKERSPDRLDFGVYLRSGDVWSGALRSEAAAHHNAVLILRPSA